MLDISTYATTQVPKCMVQCFSDLANLGDMDDFEADTQLIKSLCEWANLKPSPMAIKLGMAATTLTRPWKGTATTRIGRQTLDKLRAAYPDFPGWAAESPAVLTEVKGTGMSAAEVRDAWTMPGKVKPVPLLGTAMGGDWEGLADVELTELRLTEVLDYLGRPSSLADDPDAYAVEITGTSMVPRFEPGERVFVSPKSPVRIGDDVIVQLRAANPSTSDLADTVTAVLIKRLLRRNAEYVELRQFNPEQIFRVPIESIARAGLKLAIHRVRGRL